MKTEYRNPWHKPLDNTYGPPMFKTDTKPTSYRGFLIYRRLPACFDIVKDGTCISQRAGLNGAKWFIDQIHENPTDWFVQRSLSNLKVEIRPMKSTAFNPAPKANCRYGAPMGRGTAYQLTADFDGLIHLYRVPLDRGGYDRGGAYWGLGQPLYAYGLDDDCIEYIRANNRADAKALILAQYPHVRFYR